MYDCIIVGGGPAGLSAALLLGRCRRRVLLCDSGEPRNRWATAVNGFFSRDGVPPLQLLSLARDQLGAYDTVELREVCVEDAERVDGAFEVLLPGGARARARTLLLATGVVDDVPAIDGFAEAYGRTVHHCPYCDGWEYRDRRLAVYGRGDAGYGLALGLTAWTDHVVLCTDGPSELDHPRRTELEEIGVELREEPVERLDVTEGRVHAVRLAGGVTVPCDGVFFSTGHLLTALLDRVRRLLELEISEDDREIARVVLDRRDVVDRLAQALLQEPLERGLLDVDQVGEVEDVLQA